MTVGKGSMTLEKPAAFMTYAHLDNKYGHLTTFCERLSDQVQMQLGYEFPIFQDRKDIQWGQNWRQRIEDSLDEVTFLIPIITPGFFNSGVCREEFERFVEREKRLKRNDLILPVYYVNTPLLNDADLRLTDPLAELIASRQFADWRELRFELFTNPQVVKTLAHLAEEIRNALPRVQMKASATTSAALETEPTAATADAVSEPPTQGPTTKKDSPTVIVDPMHHGDFTTITDAIRLAEPGTRILVRHGLYSEGLVIDKPLEIIGDGGPGEIVVQAQGISVIKFQTSMGRIVNLTLRQMGGKSFCVDIGQGRLELEDCDIASQGLSCIGVYGGADPRLRRNRIHDSRKGSGVFVYDNGRATLEDNDIFGNAFSGVEITNGADPTLRRNRIHDGKQSGVHIHDNGQGTLEDNDIFSNGRGEVQIGSTSNPIMRRNRIHDSKVGSGVIVYDGGQGTLEDNDIFSNALSGISARNGGHPVVTNSRINKNASFGIRIYGNGGGTFKNNDLAKNGKGAWSISETSKLNVTRIDNKE